MQEGRLPPLARVMRAYVQERLKSGDAVPVDEVWARAGALTLSRRELLKAGGTLGAGFALAACTGGSSKTSGSASPLPTSRSTPHEARVVVVGAGLAGVTATYRLAQAAVSVQLFESRDRVGGRCWTAHGFADGQTAEHGGEFIDTRHVHMLGLAKEFGLDVDDLWKGYAAHSTAPNWVDGKLLSPTAVHAELDPIARKIGEEARRIGVITEGGKVSEAAFSYGTATPAAVEFDRLSMAEWLDQNVPGVIGSPFGAYLDETMCGWYGLEMDGLSALVWMDFFVIPTPGADERWHVRGGNDQVPNRAAERLPAGALHLETPLEAMRRRSDGAYELRFGGIASPVVADFVILAAPFSTLRLVDLTDAGFSAQRMAAIGSLGMGMDAKLLLQYDRRPSTFRVGGRTWNGWMEHVGPPHFETWESSTDEQGASGLVTVYAGGRTGAGWTADQPHGPAPDAFAAEYVGYIDDVIPWTAGHFNGTAWADLWPRDPWTNGAYAAFLPGQYTTLWGYTGRAESNVHFAGEHTSTYSQGYLNGGVESGDRAAIEVMQALGLPVPKSIANLPYLQFA